MPIIYNPYYTYIEIRTPMAIWYVDICVISVGAEEVRSNSTPAKTTGYVAALADDADSGFSSAAISRVTNQTDESSNVTTNVGMMVFEDFIYFKFNDSYVVTNIKVLKILTRVLYFRNMSGSIYWFIWCSQGLI